MNFLTSSAGCLHCPSGHLACLQCFRIFRKRSWWLPRCGQLRKCLGNLQESTQTVPKTLGANYDPKCNWSGSCRETSGSLGNHAEAMQKPCGRHESMRTPRGCHGEGFRKVPNRQAPPFQHCLHMRNLDSDLDYLFIFRCKHNQLPDAQCHVNMACNQWLETWDVAIIYTGGQRSVSLFNGCQLTTWHCPQQN